MDLNKYKAIIAELVSYKNAEQDPKKKKDVETFEFNLKKDLRSQEIQQKIEILYSQKQFIAYICVLSQFIEFKIKEIILQSQQLVSSSQKKLKLDKNWQETPLGGLIQILQDKCINDDDLMGKLRNFNKLRRRAIHNLFDTNFEIQEVENEIENTLTPSFSVYNDLINPLNYYLYKITVKAGLEIDKKGKVPKEAQFVMQKLKEKVEELNPALKDKNREKNIKV